MPHFPVLTYIQTIRRIKKCGFRFYRQARGSHEMWTRDFDKKIIVIPRHPKAIIKRKTLKSIIEASGLSVDEFRRL